MSNVWNAPHIHVVSNECMKEGSKLNTIHISLEWDGLLYENLRVLFWRVISQQQWIITLLVMRHSAIFGFSVEYIILFFMQNDWTRMESVFFSLFSFQLTLKIYRPFHLPTRNIHSVKFVHWILFDAVVSNGKFR